ncbi:MAG: hypothetical protein ACFFE8_14990 [Candidatus Heimdallarchaeota archaeon]
MVNQSKFDQKTIDRLHKQISLAFTKKRNQIFKNTILLTAILVPAFIALYFLLDLVTGTHIEKLIVIYLILAGLVGILVFPYFGISSLIAFRTRYRDYFIQVVMYLQFLAFPLCYMFYHILAIIPEFGRVFPNWIILPVGLYIVFGPLSIVILSLLVIQKPLFWRNNLEDYITTLLSQQAMHIMEYRDGYTPRPFFSKLSEINNFVSTPMEFKSSMENYAKFLAKEGEIIGWDINERIATLYPRVLMNPPFVLLDIRFLYRLFYRVYRRYRLTAITINRKEKEMSLYIARDDYEVLNDVTFHILGEQILDRTKNSIVAFLQKDYEQAILNYNPLYNEIRVIRKESGRASFKTYILYLIEAGLGMVSLFYGCIILTLLLFFPILVPSFPLSFYYAGIITGLILVIVGLFLIIDGIKRRSRNFKLREKEIISKAIGT